MLGFVLRGRAVFFLSLIMLTGEVDVGYHAEPERSGSLWLDPLAIVAAGVCDF